MKKIKIATMGLCMLTIFSCSTKQGTGSLIGAGGGALLGGIIGKIAGNTAVGAAIGGAVGAGTGAIIGRHMDKVAAETASQVENAKVEKVTDANGLKAVKVTFDSDILFDLNRASLNNASKNQLAKFSKVLKKNTYCHVAIYGYTDRSGNDAINVPLSQKRAQGVADYLNACGVSRSQFKNVEGRGSQDEIENKRVSHVNRRVEVYLYASKEMVDAAKSGRLN
ncbi:membrane protein [Prevotella sp. S7-1-8]|uniref:OmpA family protein n=1 Tax=Prevotella sp. S7-1-8 TaxID=1284775 RepID=UPI00050F8C00|nr:OmpA family protein [Prevotella sp. S7-1-8]KGF18595.1 membrane protein [Prevotella sp. S7-1-8]